MVLKKKKFHSQKNYKLVLEVYVKEGRDLAQGQLAATCNPILVLSLPNTSQGMTPKLRHTIRPHWNSKVKLKLYEKVQVGNPSLRIVVFDVQKRHPLEYLGELRVNLKDIKFGNDYQWYRLYSTNHEKRFVTGSIYLKFELKRRKKKLNRGSSTSLNTELSEDGVSHASMLWDSYLKEIDPLMESLADRSITDDQGFFNDEDDDDDDALQNLGDLIADYDETEDETVDGVSLSQNSQKLLTVPEARFHSGGSETDISQASQLEENRDSDAYSTEYEFLTSAEPTLLPPIPKNTFISIKDDINSSQTEPDTAEHSASNAKSEGNVKVKRRFKVKAKKDSSLKSYSISNERRVLGVVFLEIISAEGLPPFKSTTRTGFDMDPFVVVSFGRKVYRSSWRKHTLSPVFNERLAFEVFPFERNYEIQFNVLDKDHFSFHDNVGTAKIPILLLMDEDQLQKTLSVENPSMTLTPEDSEVSLKKNKKLIGRNPARNLNKPVSESSMLRTFNLNLTMNHSLSKLVKKETYNPTLKIRARFASYTDLRKEFWMRLLAKFDEDSTGHLDVLQLEHFLSIIEVNLSDATIQSFFRKFHKNPWAGETLTFEELVENFESLISGREKEGNPISTDGHFIELPVCPICGKKKLSHRNDADIITHVAICASRDWSTVNKLLKPSFASSQMATKRWYSKVLIKLTYGKYGIGKNSANILVQDRNTGLVMEEKMSIYVRLGIKLFYRSVFDKAIDRGKMKRLLRNLSIKQGEKFDSPASASQIPWFIRFHQLDLSECRVQDISSFKTFNQFFYRRLKPGARPLESSDPAILCSPCDSRCTVYQSVSLAKQVWIKGKEFTISKLLYKNNEGYLLEKSQLLKYENGSIGIFRLAPQDYHRFHSPCDGVVGRPMFIQGEYYTVNPMAIRSELDVFGDNVRCIIPIETKNFGTVIMIPVGAMMVGSILLSVEEGDVISRGDEVGYFKFGGSTVLILFEQGVFQFDSDLVQNSQESIETLVKVGMSLGHAPNVAEFQREYHDFDKQPEENKLRIIRSLTGGGAALERRGTNLIDKSLVKKFNENKDADEISFEELSWEAYNLTIDEEDEGLLKGLDLNDIPD